MKPTIFNRFWLMLTVLALATLACYGGQSPVEPTTPESPTNTSGNSGNGLSQAQRAKLISATVQIYGLFNDNGKLTPHYTGSGTILTSSGMILTNAHVASPATQGEPDMEPDALGIAITESEDKPPVASYLAKVLAVDGYLDLAVIQITSTIDGTSVDSNSLNFPFVELGDSNQTHVGDHVSIFGFPGIGGDTITFTQGGVSGFTSEDQLGDRAWIKTDATIAGGNSGGLAADDSARIIGVPTQASSGGNGDVTDCRQIQDTNGDGTVDQNDSCIPIGGFINALRPIQLALPLIQSAQAGRQYVSPYRVPGVASEPGSGQEAVNNFSWLDSAKSSAKNCDWSGDVVDAYSNAALCIVTGFDYSGMTNGEPVREKWYLNNEIANDFSYSWEYDAAGSIASVLPNDGKSMPEGEYYVEVYAGNDEHLIGKSGKVVVGSGTGGSFQAPQGDTITVYGLVYDADTNKPLAGASIFVLSSGITYDKWASENFPDKYIKASLETDNAGKYKITDIPRNTLFTIVYYVDGYNASAADNLKAGANDPEMNEINVGLSK